MTGVRSHPLECDCKLCRSDDAEIDRWAKQIARIRQDRRIKRMNVTPPDHRAGKDNNE